MFYYTIYAVLAFFSLGELITIPKNVKKWTFISVILTFIIIGGLRWNTGADWSPYQHFFTNFDSDNPFFLKAMEPGFVTFVTFLRLFSQDFTFYLIALSVCTISLKAVYFYRFTSALFLALILYWGTAVGDVVAVRQALAISLCAVSTIFIVERKPWIFAFIVFIAAQIHVTSFIFLFSYKIFNAEWSVKSKLIWFALAITFGLTIGSERLLQTLIDYMPDGLGLQRITGKAEAYMKLGNEFDDGDNVSKLQKTIIAILKRAILLPVFFVFQKTLAQNKKYQGFLNLYTFGNILYFVVIDFLTLQRMATYFYFFEIIIFCIIFENAKSKFVWVTIILLYSLLKLATIIISGYDLMVPYIWIFSSDTYRFIY